MLMGRQNLDLPEQEQARKGHAREGYPNQGFPRQFLLRALTGLFFLLCIYALLSVGVMTWRGYSGGLSMTGGLVGLILMFSGLVGIWLLRDRFLAWLREVNRVLEGVSDQQLRRGWWGLVLLGLFLRLGFHFLFPSVQSSDEAIYLQLAHGLLEHGELSMGGYKSFWPPGYSLMLAPILWLTGLLGIADGPVVLALNALLYLLTAQLCWSMGRDLAGNMAGLLATGLLVFWPNHIAMFGQVSKEAVLIVLLMLAAHLWLSRVMVKSSGNEVVGNARSIVLIGLVLGVATLVQPSVQLAFLAFLLAGWLLGRSTGRTLMDALLLVVGMAVIITPWAYRNLTVHQEFLLLTSNGGVILNMSNRDGVEGTWDREGAEELQMLPELEANREGYDRSVSWIKAHPMAFLDLVWKRQMHWLGNDGYALAGAMLGPAYGAANANQRSSITSPEYQMARLWANAYWAGIWWLMLMALMGRVTVMQEVRPGFVLIASLVFYVLAVHSVFESGAKYHVLLTGLLSVLATSLLVSSGQDQKNQTS